MPRRAAAVLRLALTALLAASVLTPAAAGGRRSVTFDDWPFAYHHDCERLEALASSPRWIRPDGAAAAVHARILRVLRGLVRRPDDERQFVVANAARALGKVSDDPADVTLLVRLLDGRFRARPLVLEGAVLGLGLLCRTAPARQFDAAVLDTVRGRVFEVVGNTATPARTRGLAALALGLLADQPRVHPADAHQVSLFQALNARLLPYDVEVGILMALAAFPENRPENRLEASHRAALVTGARKGRLFKRTIRSIPRAHATRLLGHLDGAEIQSTLKAILKQRRPVPKPVRRAAALAAGDLGRRAPDEERRGIVSMLVRVLETSKDTTTRTYATRSLGRILEVRMEAARPPAPSDRRIEALLIRAAAEGRYLNRPHAFLALGRSLRTWRSVGAPPTYVSFAARASALLHTATRVPDILEASAAALALGIAGDPEDRSVLRALAQGKRLDGDGRGYAALALAFLGPTPETETFLQDRLLQVTDPRERLLLTRALGIAARGEDLKTVSVLKALLQTRGCWQGEAAMALARIGTVPAARVLLEVGEDKTGSRTIARAAAIAGLGRITDPERVPSLSRLTDGIDPRATCDLVSALLEVL